MTKEASGPDLPQSVSKAESITDDDKRGRRVVATHLPEPIHPEILRDNFLNTLDGLLEADSKIVVVDGPEGRGKTVMMTQYALHRAPASVALFISGENRWSYDISQVRFDVCNQLSWSVRKSELTSLTDATDILLGILILEARRKYRKTGIPFVFIIDGLAELPPEDLGSRRQILNMLPFGEAAFRFVFSGDADRIGLSEKQRRGAKSVLLTAFSLNETTRYLNGVGLTSTQIEELHRVTRSEPGLLSSIRRLIEAGVDSEAILHDLPSKLPQPFELEWRKVENGNETQQVLLAVLAHDLRPYTIAKLAEVTGIEDSEIIGALNNLTFITLNESNAGDIRFVSAAFKRFVAQKLSDRREQVSDLLINALTKDPDSLESQELLPTYYREAGRLDLLLGFLTQDVLAGYVHRSRSLATVQRNTELGIAAARELRRDAELIRLSLQHATVAELDESQAGRAELRALAALGDHEMALAIAEGTTRREDRLLLLAALARSRREAKLPVPPEVEEQILQLHETADFGVLGNRSDTLAADLLYLRPDLAVQTVERARETKATGGALRSADWSYARLAVEARLAENDSGRSAEQVADILAKIKDPKAVRLATEAAIVFGNTSAADALSEAQRLPKVEDQVYVLRQWMMANRTRDDAAIALDHALMASIQATDYTPSATHLRELATAIPYIADEKVARRLIGIFDGQAPVVQEIGPTEDYVRLQLILARAEYRINRDAARNRVVELYIMIEGLDNLATKTVAMARLVAMLRRIDDEREFEKREGLHSVTEKQLGVLIDELLAASADHYEATKDLIAALGGHRPDLALEVITKINTEPRRDWAYKDLAVTTARMPIADMRSETIRVALSSIEDDAVRDEALEDIVEHTVHLPLKVDQLRPLMPFYVGCQEVGDPERRARLLSRVAALLKRVGGEEFVTLAASLLAKAREAWNEIDRPWERLTAGFEIATHLAQECPVEAREFVAQASAVRDSESLYSDASANGALWCLRLAIRAFAGLMPNNLATEPERERLERAISRVPSAVARADLWADLAERYFINERLRECSSVTERRIKPLLEDLERINPCDYRDTLVRCAAALFVAHRASGVALIKQLPRLRREHALYNVAEFLKRKCPLSDPYENRGRLGTELTNNDAVDLCDLMEAMESDVTIYYVAEDVIDALARPKAKISRQQKAEIARRLNALADVKFPDPRSITHAGFEIALRAQLGRLTGATADERKELVRRTLLIPNIADQAFVLAIIASTTKDARERATILRQVEVAIGKIPILIDQVDHYRLAGSMLIGVDTATSKEYLKTGLKYSLRGKGIGIVNSRREIVDLAYRVDPEFASKLASDIDDDPAKDRLKRRIALHELKKSMAQQRANDAADVEAFDYSRAAWMRLGALNANRVDHVPMDTALRYLDFASGQPLTRSFPIFALLVENAVRRHARTDAARSMISPMFEAALLGAELANHASSRAKSERRAGLEEVRVRVTQQRIVVEPEQRAVGIEFIRKWLEANTVDHLKIVDPYFTTEDLELLRLVKSVLPSCKISILASRKAHLDAKVPQDWQDTYLEEWNKLSDDLPPRTDIVIVGNRTAGGGPIHDRWWIARGCGLELGASWNGIGVSKASSIRVMDLAEAEEKERLLDEFVINGVKEHKGERYVYTTVALGDD